MSEALLKRAGVGQVWEAIKGWRIIIETLLLWVKFHKSLLSPEAQCVPGRSERGWVLPPGTVT